MYDDILLPVDGSQSGDEAVVHAGAVASRFEATVHVLHAVDLPTEAIDVGAGGPTADVVDLLTGEGERLVAEAAAALPDDVATTETVMDGTPAVTIREYADEHGIDLVVMGTHGRTGVERYLIGSTAERVVRTADCPVLTVGESAD